MTSVRPSVAHPPDTDTHSNTYIYIYTSVQNTNTHTHTHIETLTYKQDCMQAPCGVSAQSISHIGPLTAGASRRGGLMDVPGYSDPSSTCTGSKQGGGNTLEREDCCKSCLSLKARPCLGMQAWPVRSKACSLNSAGRPGTKGGVIESSIRRRRWGRILSRKAVSNVWF